MKKNRAFLKWAGGKYPLVDEIRRYLPAGKRLIEPFVGAGSVFLNTDYEEYLLADINADLINLYNIVKTQPDNFVRDAKVMFSGEFNQSEMFYALRSEFNQSQDQTLNRTQAKQRLAKRLRIRQTLLNQQTPRRQQRRPLNLQHTRSVLPLAVRMRH